MATVPAPPPSMPLARFLSLPLPLPSSQAYSRPRCTKLPLAWRRRVKGCTKGRVREILSRFQLEIPSPPPSQPWCLPQHGRGLDKPTALFHSFPPLPHPLWRTSMDVSAVAFEGQGEREPLPTCGGREGGQRHKTIEGNCELGRGELRKEK